MLSLFYFRRPQSSLFSAGYDGKMLLWDISTKDPIASCAAAAPISSACQLTPDLFAAACIDGSCVLSHYSPPKAIAIIFCYSRLIDLNSYSLHDMRTQATVSNFGKRAKGRPQRIVRLSPSSFAIAGSGKRCNTNIHIRRYIA